MLILDDGSVKMAGTADTGTDSEVLPAERRRLLDEHPHIREPRPSRPTDGRLPLHGRYGSSVCLADLCLDFHYLGGYCY